MSRAATTTDAALCGLAAELAAALKGAGEQLAVAESCTGGLLAKVLTDLPGSSAWFERGLVTYSNAAKRSLLGVSAETLDQYGAVSGPVVLEMASGLLARSPVQWTVAISGIAGPDGGNAEKPVGTVWIAFAAVTMAPSASRYVFSGDRDAVRRAATDAALTGLLELFGGRGA